MNEVLNIAQEKAVHVIAHPNIAFIKYWGDTDSLLRIPANSSISMNLEQLSTYTTVKIDQDLTKDEVYLNNQVASASAFQRIEKLISYFRQRFDFKFFFKINSNNNFPIGSGIASSASGFAALALAISKACDLNLDEIELSRIARLGSGSASRSIPGGFVEWQKGYNHETSFSTSIASEDHWDLIDCIVIVDDQPKTISSTEGHALASSSPLQQGRLKQVEQNLVLCRQAIIQKDFQKLAYVVELDSNLMHAVMMTSSPPLFYWQPTTLLIIKTIQKLRSMGFGACYTIDAGANVHVICLPDDFMAIINQLQQLPNILKILQSHPGGPARLV